MRTMASVRHQRLCVISICALSASSVSADRLLLCRHVHDPIEPAACFFLLLPPPVLISSFLPENFANISYLLRNVQVVSFFCGFTRFSPFLATLNMKTANEALFLVVVVTSQQRGQKYRYRYRHRLLYNDVIEKSVV